MNRRAFIASAAAVAAAPRELVAPVATAFVLRYSFSGVTGQTTVRHVSGVAPPSFWATYAIEPSE